MTRPKLFINLSKTDVELDINYFDLPRDRTIDIIEAIRERGDKYEDLMYLMIYCEAARRKKVLRLYLSKNPNLDSLHTLIEYCEAARRKKVLRLYLSKNPTKSDLLYLMTHFLFARRKKVLRLYLSKNPNKVELEWLRSKWEWVDDKINELKESTNT